MIINHSKYAKNYDEKQLWSKLTNIPRKVGKSLIRKVLIVYLILTDKGTPTWVKIVIIAVLGYFICPVDAIPDAIPFAGYTDDLAALAVLLGKISAYDTAEIREKAKALENKLI